jgi:uncharacterized protein
MDNLNNPSCPPGIDSTAIAGPHQAIAPAADPAIAVDVETAERSAQATQPPAPEIPTLGNTLLFFVLAVGITLSVGILIVVIAALLAPHHSTDFRALAFDARIAIPAQALEYLTLLSATAALFRSIWQRPFWQAIHWNAPTVIKRWVPLLITGVALGLLNGAASNLLPMPKEAPILNDLMHSTAGAWLMFLFGTTLAPLLEEIAFRGFLLPSLINFLNARTRRKQLPEGISEPLHRKPPSPLIVPGSILLASVPFALLHSEQVSGAWAPVLLIGVVSLVLCVIRLWTRSLAASAFVHATYNFTLFAGMAIASDGFRHLDKLNS